MLFRRCRITLVPLLASIAILALPVALYAPDLRGDPDRWILAALIAHCVELVAFLWLVLIPIVRLGLARWHGTQAMPSTQATGRVDWLWDHVLLGMGPCLAVLLPVFGWGSGYRLPGFMGLEGVLFLLVLPCNVLVLIPLGLGWAVSSSLKRSKAFLRSVTTVVLLLLVIPCIRSIEPASELGRISLEQELGLARLARECVRLVESRGRPGRQEILQADEVGSPALRRLRPSYVLVEHQHLRIELHGGFAHHGYELTKDEPNGQWVFEWYSVEDGKSQRLLTWAIGDDP